ncbi:hypothetical protein V2O64_16450 [Verrucomicrobiaceae bacterium 227]
MLGEGGPFKRTATWIAEKVADVLLGGDVLDPRRDGAEIDWDGVKIEKPRQTVVAVLARIQLELALGAANRRLEEALDPEGCGMLIAKAKELGEEENIAAKLSESCSMTITGMKDSRLEAEISGSGVSFEVLCDEMWNRSSEVREGSTKKPGLSTSPGS